MKVIAHWLIWRMFEFRISLDKEENNKNIHCQFVFVISIMLSFKFTFNVLLRLEPALPHKKLHWNITNIYEINEWSHKVKADNLNHVYFFNICHHLEKNSLMINIRILIPVEEFRPGRGQEKCRFVTRYDIDAQSIIKSNRNAKGCIPPCYRLCKSVWQFTSQRTVGAAS